VETGRFCGECSLCCTVLRVDERRKQGGTDCEHQRVGGGCAIHSTRPQICRGYRCLWLQGGLDAGDRPDQLGAVMDLVTEGGATRFVVQEAHPGAFDATPRLAEIAAHYRESMPVRIVEAGNVLDPDRPYRVLLPSGEEQRVRGETIELYRDGARVGELRMGWIERMARRLAVRFRTRRVRRNIPPS